MELTLEDFFELLVNGDIKINKYEVTYSDKDKEIVEVEAVFVQPINRIIIDVKLNP